jgi:hypothetical protein
MLAPQIGLELGEYAQHVEEGPAGGGARVDRLLGRTQRDASTLQLVNYVLQVLQRARETIDASNDQRVAWLHEVEQHL